MAPRAAAAGGQFGPVNFLGAIFRAFTTDFCYRDHSPRLGTRQTKVERGCRGAATADDSRPKLVGTLNQVDNQTRSG